MRHVELELQAGDSYSPSRGARRAGADSRARPSSGTGDIAEVRVAQHPAVRSAHGNTRNVAGVGHDSKSGNPVSPRHPEAPRRRRKRRTRRRYFRCPCCKSQGESPGRWTARTIAASGELPLGNEQKMHWRGAGHAAVTNASRTGRKPRFAGIGRRYAGRPLRSVAQPVPLNEGPVPDARVEMSIRSIEVHRHAGIN